MLTSVQARKLSRHRGGGKRNIVIAKCHGSSELQAVLTADNTSEVVTLTSNRVICMFPLLGLMHHTGYRFDGSRSAKIDGYEYVASHQLPGPSTLAKATRRELKGQRSLGDDLCFVVPLCDGPRSESGWKMEIRPKGMVNWVVDFGVLSCNWTLARSMIETLQLDKSRLTRH